MKKKTLGTRIIGRFGYKAPPRLYAPHLPIKKAQLPVYRPTRGTFVHNVPRNDFLCNLALKYPIYQRLPKFWRDEYELKRPILHQVVKEGSKRPQHEGLWFNDNGKIKRVYNYPVKTHYPPHSDDQIWAGEGVIFGFKPAKGDINNPVKYPREWYPSLLTKTFYSEILNRQISTKFTMRALDLIDESFGFDNFVLKTPSKILQRFGSSLKREMLIKLAKSETDLYPDNPQKRKIIFEKYKKFKVPLEQAEWTGLTLIEAMHKQWEHEKEAGLNTPLLEIFTKELKAKLGSSQSSEESIQVFDMAQIKETKENISKQ